MKLFRYLLLAGLLAIALAPKMSAQLPHQSLGHLVTPTEWNDVIDAVNASTSTLATGLKFTSYTPTLANVQNTTTETTILSFSLPANAMSNGDEVEVLIAALVKNNSGAASGATFKVNVGAGAQVTLGVAGLGGTTVTAADDATEYQVFFSFTMQRVGTAVWVRDGLSHTFQGNPWAGRAIAGVSTPTNFTGANTVSLKATLGAAHSTFYIKPQYALVGHKKVS